MKTLNLNNTGIALALAVVGLPTVALAQAGNLSDVVVTSTRLPAGLSVTPGAYVISRQEIDDRQLTFVSEALQTAPGLAVFSNGLFGLTSVRQRGAGPDKTLVLVDGIPVNDGSQPTGSYDFAGLDIDDIERIEILSGPQASLWGSDSIGGVVSLISREPAGLRATVDGGAFGTVRGSFGAGRSADRWAIGVTASHIRSDGISKADPRNNYAAFGFPAYHPSEEDGVETTTAGLRGWITVSDTVELDGSVRYNDSTTDIDGYRAAVGYVLSDTDDIYKSESVLSQARAVIQAPAGFRHELSVSGYRLDRDSLGESGNYGYKANRRILRWTVEHGGLNDRASFKAGAEHIDNRATLSTGDKRKLGGASAFVVARFRPTEPLTVTVSGRYDDPDNYKGVATGRVGASYAIGGGVSVEGSFGQGFKTPSISQTACDFCYAPPVTLKPEHAEGYDGGFAWRSVDGRFSGRLTGFRTDIRDELAYRDLHYVNLAKTRSRGVELTGEATLGGGFRVKGAYTYTDAINAITGARQLRQPRNAGSTILFRRGSRVETALTVRAESSQVDTTVDGFSLVNRKGFTVADIAAAYALNENVRLTGRVENIGDVHYQESFGFAQPGRAIYVGVRLAR